MGAAFAGQLWEFTVTTEEQKGGKTQRHKPQSMRNCQKDDYNPIPNMPNMPGGKMPDCKLVSGPADYTKTPMTTKFECTEGKKTYTIEQTIKKMGEKEMESITLIRYDNGDFLKMHMIGKYIGTCK
ncbi:MAG: hypothetical protein ABDH18_04745 [Aquificaceae bacterium]